MSNSNQWRNDPFVRDAWDAFVHAMTFESAEDLLFAAEHYRLAAASHNRYIPELERLIARLEGFVLAPSRPLRQSVPAPGPLSPPAPDETPVA